MPNKRSQIRLTSGGLARPRRVSCCGGNRSPNRRSSSTRGVDTQTKILPGEKKQSAQPASSTTSWVTRTAVLSPRNRGQPYLAWRLPLVGYHASEQTGESQEMKSQGHITQKTMERTETLSLGKQSLRGIRSSIKKLLGTGAEQPKHLEGFRHQTPVQ